MRVKLIDDMQELYKLQDSWNDVLKKSRAKSPFLTFEWLSSWWNSFRKGKRLFVLTANESNDGPLCGIAPLMLTKSVGFRIIEFIGSGLSDYLDFIILDRADDTIKAFFACLNKHKKSWDLIFLSDILSSHGNVERLLSHAQAAGWGTCYRRYTVSPYLAITGDWSQFLSSKSSNFRYTLKRKKKRLQKHRLKLQISKFNSNDFDHRIFEDIVKIERNSWKFDAGTAKMQEPQQKKFYSAFLRVFSRNGWMNLWMGYLNDSPVAYLINFDYGEKIWFYNAAYHSRFSKYSIGSILTHQAVEDAFSTGKTEYDFMRGDEGYKDQWTSKKRESFQLIFYKKSLRSTLGYFFLFRLRWLLAKCRKLQEGRLYFKGTSHRLKKGLSEFSQRLFTARNG